MKYACLIFTALLLLAGCDNPAVEGVRQSRDAIENPKPPLPPAIVAPLEGADPAESPSYEVGIATAAADRQRTREKCAEKRESERAACEAEAEAAYETTSSALEDLRGNQQ